MNPNKEFYDSLPDSQKAAIDMAQHYFILGLETAAIGLRNLAVGWNGPGLTQGIIAISKMIERAGANEAKYALAVAFYKKDQDQDQNQNQEQEDKL